MAGSWAGVGPDECFISLRQCDAAIGRDAAIEQGDEPLGRDVPVTLIDPVEEQSMSLTEAGSRDRPTASHAHVVLTCRACLDGFASGRACEGRAALRRVPVPECAIAAGIDHACNRFDPQVDVLSTDVTGERGGR